MVKLLMEASQHPDQVIILAIALYTYYEIQADRQFPEVFQFISQAYQSPQENVRAIATTLVAQLTQHGFELVKKCDFNYL